VSELPPEAGAGTTLALEPAIELAALIRRRELGIVECVQAFLYRIEQINPRLNAIVSLQAEAALAQARAMDNETGDVEQPLRGLPIAIKDLVLTRGIRTTFGSPLYADFIPDIDELFVTRLKRAGAIIIGKTNTPEFGAGSQTFNPVFGATRNPYALDRTCGGSSGGAAAALAGGLLPFADGSDLGGSLRNPASFCNVVGFRPSPGRVPNWPKQFSSEPWSVSGPLARSVDDAALLLSVMAGPDLRSPISLPEPGATFRQSLSGDAKGMRFAFSEGFGQFPVDTAVTDVLRAALPVFETIGGRVAEDAPDLRDAAEIFSTFRAWLFATRFRDDYAHHADKMKQTVRWNIEQGLQLTLDDVTAASVKHSALVGRVAEFFDSYDFLLCPAAQVPPFPLDDEWVSSINGIELPTYLDWMGVCWAITVTGCPAISVPAGFTPDGLPIGMQIVGRRGHDFDVLRIARAFEQATGYAARRPSLD
jgi:amidase